MSQVNPPTPTASPLATEALAPRSVAEAFLLQLRARGIEHFFVNAGTDFAPLVEAYARLGNAVGVALPVPMVAGHENLAVGMAHGAYLMSGRPQAAMFHVNVGTANAVCGLMNAKTERVPLLLCAGRTPIHEHGRLGARNTRIAWAQEMYDPAALVRETAKWEYELRHPLQAEAVLDRALQVACSEPRGPVYLTLPREVLAEPWGDTPAPSVRSAMATPSVAAPDPAAVAELADRLAMARAPVVLAMASGADPDTVALLSELCSRFGIGYAEEQARYLNLPHDHPLHLGFAYAPVFAQADVLLCLECDVPWMPALASPRAETYVAQAGVDPNFGNYPIRSHRSDLAITSGSAHLLRALIDALAARAQHIDPARAGRMGAWARTLRERSPAPDAAHITTRLISDTLGALIDDDCTVFNEYFGDPAALRRRTPRSYYYLPAVGGLGWAVPAAIGAKLKAPERTMIALVGDGTYLFSNPVACHHAARKHGLPTLTVVANNARWNAVDATARMMYPAGELVSVPRHALSDLAPSAPLEAACVASGGFGAVVAEPAQLERVLRDALHAVRVQGRQAVVNALCV